MRKEMGGEGGRGALCLVNQRKAEQQKGWDHQCLEALDQFRTQFGCLCLPPSSVGQPSGRILPYASHLQTESP